MDSVPIPDINIVVLIAQMPAIKIRWQEIYGSEGKGTRRLLDDQPSNILLFFKSNRPHQTKIPRMRLNREYLTRFNDLYTYMW